MVPGPASLVEDLLEMQIPGIHTRYPESEVCGWSRVICVLTIPTGDSMHTEV